MARRKKEEPEPTTYQAFASELTVDPCVHIEVRPVYSKDRFAMHLGSRPFVEHAPYTGSDGPGEIEGAYAVASFKNRPQRIEYFVGSASEEGACRAALNRLVPWLAAVVATKVLPPGYMAVMKPSELHRRVVEEAEAERKPEPPVKTHPLFATGIEEAAEPDTEPLPEDEEPFGGQTPEPSDTAWRDAGR